GAPNVSTATSVREQHGRDESMHEWCHRVPRCAPPHAVVWPQAMGRVQRLAVLCHRCHVPMVPFGTSLQGAVNMPLCQGGACFDLSRMDVVTERSLEDCSVSVEPSLTLRVLSSHLHGTRLCFPASRLGI
ncbi:LDHD protein, partial [Halcyon senegalensis]|nr:LDHD protein [Halcyon senegalensis]